jgi:hypothetical protein
MKVYAMFQVCKTGDIFETLMSPGEFECLFLAMIQGLVDICDHYPVAVN